MKSTNNSIENDAINFSSDLRVYARDRRRSAAIRSILEEAANYIDALSLSKYEWVSCSHDMPYAEFGESSSVLTIDSFGLMRVAYFDGGNWCEPSGEAIRNTMKFPITHWMPLPDPPNCGADMRDVSE